MADIMELFEALLAETPGVLRCKDCAKYHYETGWCDEHSAFVKYNHENEIPCSPADSPEWKMFMPDDFCSRGERKDD